MPSSNPQVQLAREWLDRAGLDLRLARLAVSDASLSGLAAFHCQQAAEKAFKAFLAWNNQPLPKTHDLPALLAPCQAFEPTFASLQHAASTLDVYLTIGRYPDAGPEPSVAEAGRALQLAEQVLSFVAGLFPQGNQP